MSAQVAPGTTFSGSRVIDSGRALANAVRDGRWLEGGTALLDTVGDAAAALTDPIATLTSCGLGWVMEHLRPLSTWLEQLTGSAANVAQVAAQWTSTGASMRRAGADLSRRLADLDGLSGGSITAYVRFATDAARHLGASGEWAEAAASGLVSASTLVTRMQGVVKTAISKVVAAAIEAMAVVAASFGLGMGYAIARVVTKVNEMVTKVVRPLRAVLGSVTALTGLVRRLRGVFDETSTTTAAALRGGAQAVRLEAGPVADAAAATRYASPAASDLRAAGLRADAMTRPFVSPTVGDVVALPGVEPTADGPLDGRATLDVPRGGPASSLGHAGASLGAGPVPGPLSGVTGGLLGGAVGGTAAVAAPRATASGTGIGGLRAPVAATGATPASSRSRLGQRRRDLRVVIQDADT
ncbi:hypothetical protein [uncultured Microbacterium sp.]|uniref:hypothetical protein n=1 Tax=uncultured Microbacterium sp. TaxID=191216 RepID=UPI0025F80FCB|nr:hypothetical protein [uncultured Microbacterium sp.]